MTKRGVSCPKCGFDNWFKNWSNQDCCLVCMQRYLNDQEKARRQIK